MTEIEQDIERILGARSMKAALGTATYKAVLVKIHPDRCMHPKAVEAMAKLNALRDASENGIKLADDAGPFKAADGWAEFPINDSQRKAQAAWNRLTTGKDVKTDNFKKYLPSASDTNHMRRHLSFRARAVQLENLTLSQPHVCWALSRMLEFASWMEGLGLVHGTLHPGSVFITPEDHGIQVTGLYTVSEVGKPLTGASGKYLTWYPAEARKTKLATNSIDTEMCMRTAAYLLGDKSGLGVSLRKRPDVNQAFLEFILRKHSSPSTCWREYRELLTREFKKEFVPLDL